MTRSTLAIVLIVKDEDSIIFEWIAHHAALGVDHFYIYDNGSRDRTRAEIAAFPEWQKITVIDWPLAPGQMAAYEDALRRFGKRHEWMAFIDADEFIVLPVDTAISDVLNDFPDADGLAVPWQLFGTNGHDRRPAGRVLANFTRRSKDDFVLRRHVKCIMRPARTVSTAGHPHMFSSRNGRIVREDGAPVDESVAVMPDAFVPQRLRLHHYVLRSREDFAEKLRRGAATPTGERDAAYFAAHDRNEVEDLIALKYLPAIEAYEARRDTSRPNWLQKLYRRWFGP